MTHPLEITEYVIKNINRKGNSYKGATLKVTDSHVFGSKEADDCIKPVQLKKLHKLTETHGIQWKYFHGHQIQQGKTAQGRPRLVWVYVVEGVDEEGFIFTYHKYEANAPGFGQSHVYVNHHIDGIKLSALLDGAPKTSIKFYSVSLADKSEEKAIELIREHEWIYPMMQNKTSKLKRLHDLRWKL